MRLLPLALVLLNVCLAGCKTSVSAKVTSAPSSAENIKAVIENVSLLPPSAERHMTAGLDIPTMKIVERE